MLEQPTGQFLGVEVALERAVDGQRDLAGLLRNHDGGAVGLLADSDRRTMARAEVTVEFALLAERQETGGGCDAVALQERGAVVQRCAGAEDVAQQLARDGGVEADAALDVVAQALIRLDHDQRPDRLFRHLIGGLRDLADACFGLGSRGRDEE